MLKEFMTYSIDFRRKVLSVQKKEKLTNSEVANRFDIGIATLIRWKKRLEVLCRRRENTKIDAKELLEDVKKYPDSYNYERAIRLNVSTQGIRHALKRLKITYKKNTKSSQSQQRRTAYIPERN